MLVGTEHKLRRAIMADGEESAHEKFIERERQKFEDVKGYLEANSEASTRSRNLIVALIVASVLTAVGVLNSLPESWMNRRIEQLRSSDSSYLVKYIGESPNRSDYDRLWKDKYVRDRARYDSYEQSIATVVSSTDKASPSQSDLNAQDWFAVPPNPQWYIEHAHEEFEKDKELYLRRYIAFLGSASSALVDNRFFVRVPFF